jgi:hypothetical protein
LTFTVASDAAAELCRPTPAWAEWYGLRSVKSIERTDIPISFATGGAEIIGVARGVYSLVWINCIGDDDHGYRGKVFKGLPLGPSLFRPSMSWACRSRVHWHHLLGADTNDTLRVSWRAEK